MLPIGSKSRRMLNQSTHSRVANSTPSKLRHYVPQRHEFSPARASAVGSSHRATTGPRSSVASAISSSRIASEAVADRRRRPLNRRRMDVAREFLICPLRAAEGPTNAARNDEKQEASQPTCFVAHRRSAPHSASFSSAIASRPQRTHCRQLSSHVVNAEGCRDGLGAEPRRRQLILV
jgi:hypothetical protein